MGLHARLGAASPASALDKEVVRMLLLSHQDQILPVIAPDVITDQLLPPPAGMQIPAGHW